MSKDGWKAFLIIGALIVIPFGTWAGIGIYALTQVSYAMRGYKINHISMDAVSMTVAIKVYNPSFIQVDILGYDINVFLNGNPVANIKNDSPYSMKPKQLSVLTLPIDIDWKKSLKSATSQDVVQYLLTNQTDKIVLTLKGKFKGRLLGVPIGMKIDMSYTLAQIIEIMQEPDTLLPGETTKKAA